MTKAREVRPMFTHRPPPMTAEQARKVLAEMRAKTPRKSQLQLLRRIVRQGVGNLGPAAQELYAHRLDELEAEL